MSVYCTVVFWGSTWKISQASGAVERDSRTKYNKKLKKKIAVNLTTQF